MLTLIPAGRTIIDRRREARGTLRPARPISSALPGIERVAELLGREVTRRPAPYIIAVLAVTIGLGYAATDIEAEFSIRDLLPEGGSVLEDLNTLDASVGGSTEITSVLISAEATETRTLLNLQDLAIAFRDDRLRPTRGSRAHRDFVRAVRPGLDHRQRGTRRQIRSRARGAVRGSLRGNSTRPNADAGVH